MKKAETHTLFHNFQILSNLSRQF